MEKKIKYARLAILFLTVILFSVNVSGQTQSKKKKLTIMIYMCGSNLESESGAASRDLQEILRTGYNTDEVNVLAMLGGSAKWWGGFPAKETSIYDVAGRRPQRVYSDDLMNMGQADSLEVLLNYGYTCYPAEKYALVMWDHGGGPMGGVCWDSLFGADNLSMNEFRLALQNSPVSEQPLEWIGFDACLMASAETAKLVSPFARYMIASEDTEPGSGWDYSFIKGIEKDTDGEQTGKRVIETYEQSMENCTDNYTMSCIDLSLMKPFEQAVDRFFEDMYAILNADTYLDISVGRQDSAAFGRSDEENADCDLVDLKDLVLHLMNTDRKTAKDLLDILDSMILANSSSRENCYGLSVYHPYYNKSVFSSSWLKQYMQLGFSGAYQQYLRRFAAIWLGNKMADWEELFTEEQAASQGTYEVQMTPEQTEQFVSAQMIVLEEQDNGYTQVFSTDEVTVDESGTLSAEYNMEQVFVRTEDGTIIGPLYYTIQDGEYIFPAVLFSLKDLTMKKIQYHCILDEYRREFSVISTFVYDEVSETYTNRLNIDNSQFEYIYFLNYSKEMTYEETLTAFGSWEISEAVMVDSVKSDVTWNFQLEKAEDSSNLYVTFQITDSQVNTISSEPVGITQTDP